MDESDRYKKCLRDLQKESPEHSNFVIEVKKDYIEIHNENVWFRVFIGGVIQNRTDRKLIIK